MKTFFIDIITSKSGKSHKRLISILAFPCLIACLVLNCFNIMIQEELIYALAAIVIGESGFTLLEKNNNTEGKG
jgi:hypothetical protein